MGGFSRHSSPRLAGFTVKKTVFILLLLITQSVYAYILKPTFSLPDYNIYGQASPEAACALQGPGFGYKADENLCLTERGFSAGSHPASICPTVSGFRPSPQGAGASATCSYPDPVCPQGQTVDPNTGVCQKDCSSKSGQTAPTNTNGPPGMLGFKSPNNNGTWNGGSFSYDGCAVNCSQTVCVKSTDPSLYNCACIGGTYTGASSTSDIPAIPASSAPAAEKPKDTEASCLGQGKGYFTNSNGVTVCVNPVDSPTPVTKTDAPKTSTKTTADPSNPSSPPSTTTTETKDSVTSGGGGGGGSSVTRNTTVTNPDGSKSTTTETAPMDTFCEKYPTSSVCKQADDKCKDKPDLLECKELGTPSDGEDVKSKAYSAMDIQSAITRTGSCPSSVSLPRNLVFEWRPMCDFAVGIRPVVLAIAWLTAGIMIFAYFKS